MSAPVPIEPSHCPQCGTIAPTGGLHGLCAGCLWGALEETAETGPTTLFHLPGLAVQEVIARGGMGIVYRARDEEGARTVAVKMLLTRHHDDPTMRARFQLESQAVCGLDHPGILPVYRTGEHEGSLFFSMKFASGGTLAERLTDYAGKWREIATLMAGVADAVQHAHSRGVLHRDLKPGNLLFDAAGHAYVSDFGLVKILDAPEALTRSLQLMGTPHYLAPEVAAQNASCATIASDVWSLGAMLYELLAQQRPFDAPGVPGLLRTIVEQPPAPFSKTRPPTDLATIARKCLEKEPARRYASAAALHDDLTAWLEGQPIAARPPSGTERIVRWVRRHRALAAMIALVFALLGAGGVLLTLKNHALRHSLAQEQLARAAALRRSGEPRDRDAALALLTASVRDGADRNAAREEAISLLATPAMAEVRRLPVTLTTAAVLPDFSRLLMVREGRLRFVPMTSEGQMDEAAAEEIVAPEPAMDIILAAGNYLLVATQKNGTRTRRLYDHVLRQWLREWPWRTDISFCPRGRYMATIADTAQEAVIEDLTGAEPERRITGSFPESMAGPFTADGSRFALLSWKTGGAQFFQMPEGKEIARFTLPRRGDFEPSAAWRPDGGAIAIAPDVPDIQLLQIHPRYSWRRRLTGHWAEIRHLAWHPTGRWLVSTSVDGTLRVWDVARGRELQVLVRPRGGRAYFNARGDRLLMTAFGESGAQLWAFTEPAVLRSTQLPHSDPEAYRQRGPWAVALTPDGTTALAGGDQTWIVDAATGAVCEEVPTGYLNDIIITPDGSTAWFVNSQRTGRAQLQRAASGLWGLTDRDAKWGAAQGAARIGYSIDTQTMVISHGHNLTLLSTEDGRVKREWPINPDVNPVALSQDGRWAVAGEDNVSGTARLFDTSSPLPAPAHQFPTQGATYHVFSQDSRTLYSAGMDGLTARECGTWRVLWQHPTGGTQAPFDHLVSSGDGRILALSLLPHGVELRRARDGAHLATLRLSDARSAAWLALDHSATRLAITTGGHVLHCWDLRRLRAELALRGLDWEE